MKDSGVEWIGEVPEGWELCRIKNVASLFGRIGFRGYTSDDLNKDGVGAITLSPSNMLPMSMDYTKVTYLSWAKYYESPEIMINEGDLLMVKTGSSYGKVAFVGNLPQEATINPQILRIVPKESSKYLGYYMQTSLFVHQVEGSVVGGTIPTIAQEKINNFTTILPPLPEQEAIASFLDKKCGDIDSLVALQEEMIAELKAYKQSVITEAVTKGLDPSAKMKDSGVEWIGEVPEGWEVLKFKFILNLENNKTLAEDEEIYIGLENIESQSGRYIVSKIRAEGQANKFSKGNILFGKLRPYLAKVWVSEFDGCCSTELLVFSTSSNTEFYKYVLLSAGFIETINSSTYGTKMPRANAEFISQQYIPLPPLPEQHSIATYLDTKTAEIDALISIKQQKITELKEYKKSLIYECVTGKREIPTFCD